MSGKEVFPLPSIQTTALVTIALYNVLDMAITIPAAFKSFRGLYFWNYVLSTLGILVYTIGLMLKSYNISPKGVLFVTVLVMGWVIMVSGQAFVMYSKLHYLVKNGSTLRIILAMIIVNGTIGHIPIIAMVYGAETGNPAVYLQPLIFYEKVEVTIFFLQSVGISGLYIFHAVKLLREDSGVHTVRFIRLFRDLIILNIALICVDISMLGVEWSGRHRISSIYKAVAYGIKLKLEWSVLNRMDDDLLPQPSVKSVDEIDTDKGAHPQSISLGMFYGRTKIIDSESLERCDTYVANGNPCPNAGYPAGEAFRSHLNDAPTLMTRTARSTLNRWSIGDSDDEDVESLYARSRRTTRSDGRLAWEVQAGLSPSPRSRMGSI